MINDEYSHRYVTGALTFNVFVKHVLKANNIFVIVLSVQNVLTLYIYLTNGKNLNCLYYIDKL